MSAHLFIWQGDHLKGFCLMLFIYLFACGSYFLKKKKNTIFSCSSLSKNEYIGIYT